MKIVSIAVLALLLAPRCVAQTFDGFGGLLTYPNGTSATSCTNPPSQQTATYTQSGTTVTATVTDGTQYAVNEPIYVTGTGNSTLNSVLPTSSSTSNLGGSDTITNIVGNTVTMTSPVSGTVSSGVSGTFTPARFYTQNVNGAWRFCTPGYNSQFNWLAIQNMGCYLSTGADNCASSQYTTKYGSACSAGDGLHAQFSGWNFHGDGFNTTSAYMEASSTTCPSNKRFPLSDEQFIGTYTSDNLWGIIPQPTKLGTYGLNGNNKCPINRAFMDGLSNITASAYGDYNQFVLGAWAVGGSGDLSAFVKSPYFVGLVTDDQGHMNWGSGASGDFHVMNPGGAANNDCDISVLMLMTSPHQTYSPFSEYPGGQPPYVFSSTTFSSKALATNPASPSLSQGGTGGPGARTEFVEVAYIRSTGCRLNRCPQGAPSAEASIAVTAGDVVTVTSPASSTIYDHYNVYMATTTGIETLQNVSPILIGTNFTQPASGDTSTGASRSSICGVLNPCSLRDYLWTKYNGSITALNSAWSSSYTGFDSAESPFSGETAFTGAGSAINGTYTTLHSNVTPLNVQLTLTPSGGAAVAIGGDCENGGKVGYDGTKGICSPGAGKGVIGGPPLWKASRNYPQNALVTDHNGNIEQQTAAGPVKAGTVHCTWATVVGNTCPDNTATWKMLGASPGTPTIDWPSSTALALNFTFVNLATGNVYVVTTAGTTGASQPTWCTTPANCTVTDGTVTYTLTGTNIITYSTGALSLVTGQSLQTGAVLGLNYSTGGWSVCGASCGLVDEDGSGSFVGAASTGSYIRPLVVPNHATSTPYQVGNIVNDPTSVSWQYAFSITTGTSCSSAPSFSATSGTATADCGVTWHSIGIPVTGTGGSYPASTMNQTVAADITPWLSQHAASGLRAIRMAMNQLFPNLLYFGMDEMGANVDPSRLTYMQAAQQWEDVGYDDLQLDPTVDPDVIDKYQYQTLDYTLPFFGYSNFDTSQADVTCTANAVYCYSTQQARGGEWYLLQQWRNTTKSFNGTNQFAGEEWLSSHTFQGLSWGIKTATNDNAFDGNEDASTAVSCSAPNQTLTCGSESGAANFLLTNGITCTHCIQDGNALWFQNPTTVGVPATKSIMMAKIDPAWIAAETHYTGGEKR